MNPCPADLVASMIAAIEGEYAGDPEDRALFIALALEEGGYLAPAPLREEWATYDPSNCMWGRTYWRAPDEDVARSNAHSFGYEVHRRYLSDWEPVDE